MEIGKDLLKEVEKEVKRDKILSFIKNHLKKIIIFMALLVVTSLAYGSYKIYMGNKADKNSDLYYQMKDHLSTGDQKEAIVILDNLIKSGTSGYKFVSYLHFFAFFCFFGIKFFKMKITTKLWSKYTTGDHSQFCTRF